MLLDGLPASIFSLWVNLSNEGYLSYLGTPQAPSFWFGGSVA